VSVHPLYALAFKGLGEVARRELRDKLGATDFVHRTVRDSDLVAFEADIDQIDLSQLLTVEDVYYALDVFPITGDKKDIEGFKRRVEDWVFEDGITAKSHVTPRGRKGAVSYRVIVQAEDAKWRHYRREVLAKEVTDAIGRRYGKWYAAEDGGDVEVWIQFAEREAVVGLRLTDRTMRHRTDKTANLPGSLRPTVAAAMIALAKPSDDDVFLDPMCGAGTLLLERARAGRYRELLGGDIRPEAVSATYENLGGRHKPWTVREWDATSLPLENGSVTQIATNPPWGQQIGRRGELSELYDRALDQFDRVLIPGRRAVMLTSEWETLKRALDGRTTLIPIQQIRGIHVLGRRADIFVLLKT
jgi:23S rRNA G2445 N2-methylase RlmL